jgi:LmeA-like phospholipid-binding
MVVRWVRRAILIWLLSLAAFLVAADFGVRVIAQYLVARQLQESLALQDRPKVSFGGWPFLPELVSGDLASVSVDAHGTLTDQRFPTESVDATMRDVKFSLSDLLSGGNQRVRADSGEGTLTMTEDDVNAALSSDLGVTVRLKDGKVRLSSDQVEGTIEASPRISRGSLLLEPDNSALPTIRLALPDLADGLTFTGVKITGDQAVFTFELKDASFQT